MTAISFDPAINKRTNARLKIAIVIDLVLFALIVSCFRTGIPSFYLNCLYVFALIVLIITTIWVDFA